MLMDALLIKSNTHSMRTRSLLCLAVALLAVQPPALGQSDQLSTLLEGLELFYSAGATWVTPMVLGTGSVGFRLDDAFKGMLTVGYGFTELETHLAHGAPAPTRVHALLLEAAAFYPVASKLFVGPAVGLLSLDGGYDLSFSTNKTVSFNVVAPLVGVAVGYDLGRFWLTLGFSIVLGGRG